MNKTVYCQTKAGLEQQAKTIHELSMCSAKLPTDAALVQSAQDLSDATLGNIAVLLIQRQAVAQKMLANPHDEDGFYETRVYLMDYINDELRKLLAL